MPNGPVEKQDRHTEGEKELEPRSSNPIGRVREIQEPVARRRTKRRCQLHGAYVISASFSPSAWKFRHTCIGDDAKKKKRKEKKTIVRHGIL